MNDDLCMIMLDDHFEALYKLSFDKCIKVCENKPNAQQTELSNYDFIIIIFQ